MARKTRNYLALDLGASSGRGIVGKFDGRRVGLQEVYRFEQAPLDYRGSWRWDVLAMAAHLQNALGEAASRTRGDLTSLAIDTWGVDFVLLDKHDDLLGYPYQYRDARNDPAMPAAFAKAPAGEIFEITGLQFMAFNTLFQLYADVMAGGSGRLDSAASLLFMPDFLSFCLGGEKTCEYTIASTSQMLDARKRTWALPLLEKLGIRSDILLPLVEPGTRTGKLLPSIAAQTGAPRSLGIVAPGRHDTASAVAAAPVDVSRGEDWAYLSSGTWSLLGMEIGQPLISPEVMSCQFTNEGGLGGTIRLLTNIMGLWLIQELRRQWSAGRGPAPSFAEMTQAAAAAPAFGPVINPNWAPLGKPGQMQEKIVHFCKATGQTPPSSRGAMVRCALESLALAYRSAVERLQTLRGCSITRLHIVGGGSKNQLLNQLTADACGIEVITGPDEATALGNILAQLLADGQIKSLAEGREIVRASCRPRRIRPHASPAWDDAYALYRRLEGRRIRFRA